MKKIKFYLRVIWIALILLGLMLFFLNPSYFSKESISLFVARHSSHLLLTYFIISSLRGLILLPSTPFVLAGILLFPTALLSVYLISIMGILLTSTLLYFSSLYLDFSQLFSEKQREKSKKFTKRLKKNGFWMVLGWSFFPLVPTDLICFIAGSIRMKFLPYLMAIFIGESILIGVYIGLSTLRY